MENIRNAIERKDMVTLNKIAEAIYMRGRGEKRHKNQVIIEILKKPASTKNVKIAALLQAARQQAPLAIMDVPRQVQPSSDIPKPKEGADPAMDPEPVTRGPIRSGKAGGAKVARRGRLRTGSAGISI